MKQITKEGFRAKYNQSGPNVTKIYKTLKGCVKGIKDSNVHLDDYRLIIIRHSWVEGTVEGHDVCPKSEIIPYAEWSKM